MTTTKSPLGHLALSDSGFLFDTSTGSTYTLNPTGTFIVKAMIAGAPAAEIPAGLAAEFEVTEEVAGRDLAEFLLQLRESGLLQREQDNG